MTQQTIIAPATAAATLVSFSSQEQGLRAPITISADALATTETVAVYVKVGSTWIAVPDGLGGTAKLTATSPILALNAGPTYALTKSITASACGVYVDE